MKHAILLLLTISLFSCKKNLGLNFDFPSCDNPNRDIKASAFDFYTGKAMPNIKFQVYEQSLSLWGPTLIQEVTTDSSGFVSTTFENFANATGYYVKVLPNSDTSNIFPWGSLRFQKSECSKSWLILMKPVQILNLTIKNNTSIEYGKRNFSVSRVGPIKPITYLNEDINGEYSFGQITVDSIPIGFEKDFNFKVVPEEQIQISYYDSTNSLKTVKFLTDKSNISYYTLTL
jgi:hypothetical protein